MMPATILQLRGKGNVTLPMDIRRKYGLNEGDLFTLIDLGEGSFMLTPQVSRLAGQGDRIAQLLFEKGVPVDEVLKALDEERQAYYQEHYVP